MGKTQIGEESTKERKEGCVKVVRKGKKVGAVGEKGEGGVEEAYQSLSTMHELIHHNSRNIKTL